jgi:hypothetical protein
VLIQVRSRSRNSGIGRVSLACVNECLLWGHFASMNQTPDSPFIKAEPFTKFGNWRSLAINGSQISSGYRTVRTGRVFQLAEGSFRNQSTYLMTKNSPSRRIIGTDTPEPTATAQAHIAGRRGRSFPKVMTVGVSTNAPELGQHSLVLARGTSRIQRKNGPRCRIVIKFDGRFMRFSDTEDDAPPHAPKSKSGSSFSATMAFTSCWLYKWLRVSLIA